MRPRTAILGMAVVGVAQLVAAPAVLADFTTNPQVFSIPLTPTNWGPDTSSIKLLDPLAVEKFNPAAFSVGGKTAVLEGVNVRVDYEFENTLSMQFFNVSKTSVLATGSMSIEGPKGNAFLTSQPFTDQQTMTAQSSWTFPHSVTFPTQTYAGSLSSPNGGYTGQGTLQQFTGAGTISLPVVATASSTFSTSSGNGYGSSVTEAQATITISYRYLLLVPEPSSLVLAGLGCLGLLGVCRQRTRLKGLKVKAA
jgi:PEP-CTERM motif